MASLSLSRTAARCQPPPWVGARRTYSRELVSPGTAAEQAAEVVLAAREGLLARTAAGGPAAEQLLNAATAVLAGLLG
ncbi:hypothetical protein ACFV98_17795 [Streptomyces violascens]|uniref:hypothetical protein n=1 Tax=Streptomyces violascens TaxID=67381 RepID=UPI0036694753